MNRLPPTLDHLSPTQLRFPGPECPLLLALLTKCGDVRAMPNALLPSRTDVTPVRHQFLCQLAGFLNSFSA